MPLRVVPTFWNSAVKIIPERLRADGDGKGDENNKHRVFGSSGTTFVIAKAFGREHLTFLLQGTGPWPVGANDHSRPSADG
jgi:hypothetical protein